MQGKGMIETPTVVEVLLTRDEDGAIQVGNTRVLLEVVIGAYQRGDTPERIVSGFPTLSLADVYAVIAYYLSHQEQVEAYIRWVDEEGERIRQQWESTHPPTPLTREMLLARLSNIGLLLFVSWQGAEAPC
jgi:uncharacterized protein (DUF433 family)